MHTIITIFQSNWKNREFIALIWFAVDGFVAKEFSISEIKYELRF